MTSTVDKTGPVTLTNLPQSVSIGFPFQFSSDVVVLDMGQTSGVHDPALTLVLGSDYTVTGGGYNTANQMQVGSITLQAGGQSNVLVGDQIVILKGSPFNQSVSFVSTGPLTINLLEQALDKTTELAQQVNEVAGRSLQFEPFEFLSPTLNLTSRKSMLLGFDSNGNIAYYPTTSSGGLTTISQVVVQANSFVAGEAVTINSSGTWVAATANSTLVASNAVGIVQSTGLTSNGFTVVTDGVCTVTGGSFTTGSIYYVPLSAGVVTSTAPSTVGNYVYPLATASSSSTLLVNPSTPSVVPSPTTVGAYSISGNATSSSAAPSSLQGGIILGTPSFTDTGIGIQQTGSTNGYFQNILQNTSNGTSASADFIVNNNLGTATTYYGDFGINSSTFVGTGSLNLANATYLYSQNGDLSIGTATANNIHFVYYNSGTDAMTISSSGVFAPSLPNVVQNVAALKALNTTLIANGYQVTTAGYYTAGDGGQATYAWNSTSTTSMTSPAGVVVQATGVSTGRWIMQYSGPLSVKQFGAYGDGSHDDTTAIQNAINYFEGVGRGTIYIPGGNPTTYDISSPLVVNTPNIQIIGDGSGQFHDGGSLTPATKLTWTGTSNSGAMILFQTVSGASNGKINNCGLTGVYLECSGLIAYGLEIQSVNWSLFEQISVHDPTSAAYLCTCYTSGSLAEASDSQHNVFKNCVYRMFESSASYSANGFVLTSATGANADGANTSFNQFYNCGGELKNGVGWLLVNADNNCLFSCGGNPIGTGNLLTIQWPADSNYFYNISGAGAGQIKIKGTSSGYGGNPVQNTFYASDTSNNTVFPSLDSGCQVNWQSSGGLIYTANGLVTNGYSASPSSGQGSYGSTTTGGSVVIGNGSTNDFSVVNSSGTTAAAIPHGTTNFSVIGNFSVGGPAPSPSANGQGFLGAYSANGLELIGQGSTYDQTFYNKSATLLAAVPTGTTTFDFFGAFGYITGQSVGGAVTQTTSRTTAVTLNKLTGAITLFAAAGSATPATFTVNDSSILSGDVVHFSEASGTNQYAFFCTAISGGTSFNVTFYSLVGTASDSPVVNFEIIRGSSN
jgi:hypothetical protein